MKATFGYVTKKVVDYATRVRTIPRILIGIGATLFLGQGVRASFPSVDFWWYGEGSSGRVTLSDAPAEYLTIAILGVATLLIVIGVAWAFWDQCTEQRRLAKKRALVIESRGLRDAKGRSLLAAVSDDMRCRVEDTVVDLRHFNQDGRVVDPEGAVNEAMQVLGDLRRRRAEKDRDDITLVYGGLTPVPFTFLLGVLLDDEGPIVTWDWDRTQDRWRKVDGQDDGKRFEVSWQPPSRPYSEAVIAVSASYPILDENLERAFPGLPVMRLDLEGRGQDSHWSKDKQSALATQLLDEAKRLEGDGVKIVHLVVAAPNSLVFNLGKRYDRRNVPQGIVYQYERNLDPAYPWGVKLPIPGEATATIRKADIAMAPSATDPR